MGNGLFVFDMWPDMALLKDENAVRRRFMLNKEKASVIISDFSLTAADRISSLPIERGTIQRALMSFLTSDDSVEDANSLFESILRNHPEFNYANIPWLETGSSGPVKVMVDLNTGKDSKKELVRDDEGNFVLNIITEKKSKVSFTITTDPAPKDNPAIVSFEIALVDISDFSEVGVIKKAKVGTNKRASRKMSVNIADGMFDEGDYLLRVRALDENGIVLEQKKEFKEDMVQAAWEEAKEKNPNLQMEQYRLEHHVAYCNESAVFTIVNDGDVPEGQIDKRAKVNSFTQAIILYRSAIWQRMRIWIFLQMVLIVICGWMAT
ncbi:hypothetical protein BFINE_21850 [Bacteroides finegoldii DSM 17565]|nr:hypothetical protein BFINE_21850 [Bacteroides finegoldii DSM 17565]